MEDSREDRARIAQLIKSHGKSWLGALAPFVEEKSVVFERGFPSRASFRATAFDAANRDQWLSEPVLPLLRELQVPSGVAAQDLEATLRAPALSRLGVVTCEDRTLVQHLGRARVPWTFDGVGVEATVPQAFKTWDAVLRAPALASVGALVLAGQRFSRAAALELAKGLGGSAWQARLRSLEVRADVDGEVVGYAVSTLAAALPRTRIVIEGRGVLATLVPNDALNSPSPSSQRSASANSSVAAAMPPHAAAADAAQPATLPRLTLVGEHGPSPLLKAVAALHVPLGSLRLVQRDLVEPGESQLDDLRSHLRRLKPSHTSLPARWGIPDQ